MKKKSARRRRIFVAVLVAAGGFMQGAQPVFSQEKLPAAVPPGAAGMTIYVDPQTGAILKEPAHGAVPLQLTPQLRNALSTSHQGLVETPSAVAGGGVKLDLQGRFQNPLIVTIDADGKVRTQHLSEAPAVADKP